MITLHEGDNRASLRRLIDQGVRVHSVVCDPPYGLTSIGKRFGKDGAAPAKFGTDGAFARASAGFMGSKWDGTGIERDPEFWRLVWEILLPGGYVVAFSGSRTGHWQACAMEMAGFVMHPMLGWVFGQGFPKAHNAAMAIDKQLGSASPEAQQWDGWAYGGQALKPALEPIFVGQKPFSEKNGALNLLKHGVGAINIDGCRVASSEADKAMREAKVSVNPTGKTAANTPFAPGVCTPPNALGRHPANLLHDGSDEVVALFPDSGGSGAARTLKRGQKDRDDGYGMDTATTTEAALRDAGSGSAARFFNCFPPDADPVFYHGKATKADRAGSKHPTVKPIALMRWLCRLVTPPGGTVLDPFAGSGTTGAAALAEGFDCILMEAEAQFIADIRSRFGLPSDDPFADLLGDPHEDLIG